MTLSDENFNLIEISETLDQVSRLAEVDEEPLNVRKPIIGSLLPTVISYFTKDEYCGNDPFILISNIDTVQKYEHFARSLECDDCLSLLIEMEDKLKIRATNIAYDDRDYDEIDLESWKSTPLQITFLSAEIAALVSYKYKAIPTDANRLFRFYEICIFLLENSNHNSLILYPLIEQYFNSLRDLITKRSEIFSRM